jgi:transcriptional regulator with XRE-family HTH domain
MSIDKLMGRPVATSSNPTARRWELAARLRQLRLDAGKSVEEAAAELMCSAAKISRMETAGRGVQPRDVRDLCRFYGVPDGVRDDLMQAAADARKPGWWQDFRSLDEQVTTFIGLETAAEELRAFDPVRLLGQFQSPEYTTALLADLRPEGELTAQWIAETVAVRSRRQERMHSGQLRVHAITDEAVLRRPVGGTEIMVGQIDRLLADSALPNVTLQVVPFTAGPYPGLDGSFNHLRFPAGQIEDVAFVEGLLGNFLLDKTVEVDRYLAVFDDISLRFALPPDRTTTWLKALRAEISSAHTKIQRRGRS